jgi:hypothetical protein
MGPDVLACGEHAHCAGHGPACRPAGPKGAQNYDRPVHHLIGFLAGTDSQRMVMLEHEHEHECARQLAADVWSDLERRAKAEQWYLRMQVWALNLRA